MNQETFEQRRIVQLSKELDAERDKYSKLAKDSGFLNAKLKQAQEEIEQSKEKLIEYQINNHRITDNLRELERENQKLRDAIEKQQNLRSEAEVENVRQRQKIDEYKQELQSYENKTKAILFEKATQISEKDKEIYRLKEENIEVEKIYLAEKDKLQKKEQKHLRDLTTLFQQFEALKRQLNSFKDKSQKEIESQKEKYRREMTDVAKKMDQLNTKIKTEEECQVQLEQMRANLQDVVIENSQKIIELYKYKYSK